MKLCDASAAMLHMRIRCCRINKILIGVSCALLLCDKALGSLSGCQVMAYSGCCSCSCCCGCMAAQLIACHIGVVVVVCYCCVVDI